MGRTVRRWDGAVTDQIPKRLSVRDNHPLASKLLVTLNGRMVGYCTAYDINEGWIEHYDPLRIEGDEWAPPVRKHGVVMVFRT